MTPENPAFHDDVPAPPPPQRSRLGRAWRWLRWVLLVAFIKLALYAAWDYSSWRSTWNAGNAKLQPLIAELDSTDPDWRAADLCAKRNAALPPPESNAAEVALKAAKAVPASFQRWAGTEKWREPLSLGQLPRADDLNGLTFVVVECRPAIDAARVLKRFPGGGLPITFAEPNGLDTKLGATQDLRHLATVLDAAALLVACENHGDDAFDLSLASLGVGRAIGDEPFNISQLIRVAVATFSARSAERLLGLSQPGEPALAAWQAAAEAESNVPRLVAGMRGERAIFHRLMENVGRGVLTTEDHAEVGAGEPSTMRLFKYSSLRKHVPAQQAIALSLFTRMADVGRMPFGPARRTEAAAVERDAQSVPETKETMFVRLFMPAIGKLNDAEFRVVALLRSAFVAVACERFRLKTGRFPKSLAELPKELLAAIPDDPYTGTPIRFKTTDTGLVIYTTGQDGTDDGGLRLSMKGEPGTDIGFTLLHPKHRRQPAGRLPRE